MSNLQVFENEKFGEIRGIEVNGEPYIVLRDVCKVLGLNNVSQVRTRLNKDGVITNEVIDSLGRKQRANFINESNLYKVIFQSRKPEAEEFTDWVTGEVLPSIRKHGAYMTPETIEKVLLNPDTIIQLATQLKEEQSKRAMAEAEIEKQKPKVLFADSVQASDSSILVRELAIILRQNGVDIGQNRLFEWLRGNGYLVKRKGTDYNTPTQRAMDMGLFEVKQTTITHSDGRISVSKTSKVTGKGQIYFVNKLLAQSKVKAI